MTQTSGVHRLLAVAVVVAAASIAVCVLLAATPAGTRSAAFEYKVINHFALMKEASIQAVEQQRQEKESRKLDIGLELSNEITSQLARQVEGTLNELGAEGWELAGVSESFHILKRPAR